AACAGRSVRAHHAPALAADRRADRQLAHAARAAHRSRDGGQRARPPQGAAVEPRRGRSHAPAARAVPELEILMKLAPVAAAFAASFGFSLVTPAMAVQPIKAPHAAAPPSRATVDPDALQALNRMGAYLKTLNAFELTSDTTLDLVMDNGQLVQVGG